MTPINDQTIESPYKIEQKKPPMINIDDSSSKDGAKQVQFDKKTNFDQTLDNSQSAASGMRQTKAESTKQHTQFSETEDPDELTEDQLQQIQNKSRLQSLGLGKIAGKIGDQLQNKVVKEAKT